MFALAYWAFASLIYFLCFGTVANFSASFVESASSVFDIGPVVAATGLGLLLFCILRGFFDRRRLLAVLIIASAQVPFFAGFHMIKVCIPQITVFWADDAFARLDRVLHGNQDAFFLYHGLLGEVIPNAAVVTAYFPVWLTIAYVYPAIVAAFEPNEARAMHHIRLHFISWVMLGTVVALIFASAGPIYVALLTGADDFAYLDAFLQADQAAFAGVIHLQMELWTEHSTGALGSGISAFPSLHVAAATLPVVWMVERFGRYGLISALFPAVIQYGSVLTGFHYAVDGYASVIVVVLCHVLIRQHGGRAVVA
ncbi:phosphatase PAP2 family protein [Paragemmobacter ruber]|uniref:Inositolphosphotransferase Aur1/Ipt1 domain-containing protein n=1 Tax=Paragemmobacter ruber TaxID=1985673 RepID=A0ABW9Y5K1_9RHOB|nr:phosphatase PAP2 family protein [Rhodobacter ruber]NBE07144.1 hypothetical protein [Rhodobacter ruber]